MTEGAPSARRIKDRYLGLASFDQHHIVVQIPVQDTGRLELSEVPDIKTQRAALKSEPPRDRHQSRQASALERQRELLTKAVQPYAIAVMCRHHRDACQAAFGGF